MEHLANPPNLYNVGTGQGVSVKQVWQGGTEGEGEGGGI